MKRIHLWEINSFTEPDLSAFLIRIAFGLSFALLFQRSENIRDTVKLRLIA